MRQTTLTTALIIGLIFASLWAFSAFPDNKQNKVPLSVLEERQNSVQEMEQYKTTTDQSNTSKIRTEYQPSRGTTYLDEVSNTVAEEHMSEPNKRPDTSLTIISDKEYDPRILEFIKEFFNWNNGGIRQTIIKSEIPCNTFNDQYGTEWKSCVMGQFKTPDTITLYNMAEYSSKPNDHKGMAELTSTICHELRHAYEYNKYDFEDLQDFWSSPHYKEENQLGHFYEQYLYLEKKGKITWTQDSCFTKRINHIYIPKNQLDNMALEGEWTEKSSLGVIAHVSIK